MAVYEWKVSNDYADYRETIDVLNRKRIRNLLPVIAAVEFALCFTGFAGRDLGVLALAVGAFALIWYLLWPSLMAKRTWKLHGYEENTDVTIYHFNEDGIECISSKGESLLKYSAICGLAETETLYLLYTAPARAFYLPKQAFEAGFAHDFKDFVAAKTGKDWVKKDGARRFGERRVVRSIAAVTAAFVLALAVEGVGYLKQPITFNAQTTEGVATTCTVKLPRFLQETPSFGSEPAYIGNGITVSAEFYSNEQIQWKFDNNNFEKPLTLENFAAFQKKLGETDPKVDWVSDDTRGECYIQYTDGSDYFYRVLHATEDGCWQLTFTCPGERQDTYYNRFDAWRLSAEYQ